MSWWDLIGVIGIMMIVFLMTDELNENTKTGYISVYKDGIFWTLMILESFSLSCANLCIGDLLPCPVVSNLFYLLSVASFSRSLLSAPPHRRARGPSTLARPIEALEISETDLQPVSIMHRRNSSYRISMAFSTPFWPSY